MTRQVFTPEQVTALNEYQAEGTTHPFTCAHGHGTLVATVRGWICPYCDYTQDWAHDFMFNGEWKSKIPDWLEWDIGKENAG